MADRTPEERERARAEREARRARREGRAAPPAEPARTAPEPAADPPSSRPAAQTRTSEPVEEPPATNRDWRRVAGEPDPDPPTVRRVERGATSEEPAVAPAALPEPARPDPPARRIPPPPSVDGEEPLGTRRVSFRGGRGGGRRPPAAPRTGRGPSEPGSGRARAVRRTGALLALAAVAAVLWFAASLFQPFAGAGGADVVVDVPKGASVSQVGDLLADRGVIGSSFFFKLRARLEGKDDQLNSGRITLRTDMSYAAALDALTQPAKAAPKLATIVVPEGRSRQEISDIARQAGLRGSYLQASKSSKLLDPRRFGAPKGVPLEGFLFPATYRVKPNASAADLVAQQLKAFRRTIARVDLKRAERKNLTTYDVLTIASMIEREAGIARDRPLISAVIYNRLKDGMPLGIDATLRYELNNWTRPLKVSELERDSPYNTRTRTGLPPTPIGNPGLASIEAAAHPANVDYLFYVVKPCGNGASNFSSTDAEFQQDVAAYNRKREELGGKSPVTCK